MIADHAVALLVVQLVVPPDDWWCHPSYDITFGSATTRDLSRIVARVCECWYDQLYDWWQMPRLVVRSVAGLDDWPYDRSHDAMIDRTIGRRTHWLTYDRAQDAIIDRTIGQWSLPLVARLPTTDLAINNLQLFGDRQIPFAIYDALLEIIAGITDRSHLGQIATNRTIQKSYDPVWPGLGVGKITRMSKLQSGSEVDSKPGSLDCESGVYSWVIALHYIVHTIVELCLKKGYLPTFPKQMPLTC